MEFYKVKCWPLTSLIILIVLKRNLFPAEKSLEALQCFTDLHANLLIWKPFATTARVRSYCRACFSDFSWVISPWLENVAMALEIYSGSVKFPAYSIAYQLVWWETWGMTNFSRRWVKWAVHQLLCLFGIRLLAALQWVVLLWIFAVNNMDVGNLHTCLLVQVTGLPGLGQILIREKDRE